MAERVVPDPGRTCKIFCLQAENELRTSTRGETVRNVAVLFALGYGLPAESYGSVPVGATLGSVIP